MVSVRATVLVVLLVTAPGDAFLPFMNMYRDTQNAATGMACRWYNMPPYANAIATQGPSNVGYNQAVNGGSLSYLTGLTAMLNRLYPESIAGSTQTRPRVIVRVEETATVRNRNPAAVTLGPGGNGNRELDYSETDPQYYYEEDGYTYDDYSDPDGYTDTVTYYDMPSTDARGTGNVFQTWYGTGLNAPSASSNTNPCNVCATSTLLNLLMG